MDCQPGLSIRQTNRAPEEWPELFGNPLLASAGLDRLTYQVHVVVITGSRGAHSIGDVDTLGNTDIGCPGLSQ